MKPWHCGEIIAHLQAQEPKVENYFHCVWPKMIAQHIIMALFLYSTTVNVRSVLICAVFVSFTEAFPQLCTLISRSRRKSLNNLFCYNICLENIFCYSFLLFHYQRRKQTGWGRSDIFNKKDLWMLSAPEMWGILVLPWMLPSQDWEVLFRKLHLCDVKQP